MYLGWNSGAQGYSGFARAETDLDLDDGNEIFLQFDAIDNLLQLWAWRVDEPMPSEPQLTYLDEDRILLAGEPGVGFDAHGVESSAIYRTIEVREVPEPSSIHSVIATIAFTGALMRRARRRRPGAPCAELIPANKCN